MNERIQWRLVIEYGPRHADGSHDELGAVQLCATEEVADEAARALLDVMSKVVRRAGMQYGVAIRMDRDGEVADPGAVIVRFRLPDGSLDE